MATPPTTPRAALRPLAAVAAGLSGAFAAYRRAVTEHPYKTNSITSGTLMALGDRLAQHLEHKRARAERHPDEVWQHNGPTLRQSWGRTGIGAVWASGVSSPFWTAYYAWLARRFPGRVFMWVGVTACVPAPLWNLLFFWYTGIAEHIVLDPDPWASRHKAIETVKQRIRERYVRTITRSAQVWIPVNLANFLFVPLEWRMAVGSVIAFVWNGYLSLATHAESERKRELQEQQHGVAKDEGGAARDVATASEGSSK